MEGSNAPGSIGLVVPFDTALDREFWAYLPEDVDLYVARTPHVSGPLGLALMSEVSEPEKVLDVSADMAKALAPDVVVYGCTSGSFLRGLDACHQLHDDMISRGCTRAGSTSEFLLDALHFLDVGRLGVATPYDDELTGLLVDFLHDDGVEVGSVVNLGMTGDPRTVSADRVARLAIEADSPDADAIFLSCTNLRTLDLVPTLEAELDKPVITANQVTMWGALRVAGLATPGLDQRLFG